MNAILPLIPYGASQISENLSVINKNGYWFYHHGCFVIFKHPANDNKSFRMITSSFLDSEICKVKDIVKTFAVSKSSVIRNHQKYIKLGSPGFYTSKKGRKKGQGTILIPSVIKRAEELLNTGFVCKEVALKLKIKPDTLHKGISDGRVNINRNLPMITNKSERSAVDLNAVNDMGVACTRSVERVSASVGMLYSAKTSFTPCYDVPNGGVLVALPALELNGLFHEVNEVFPEFKGYYTTVQVLILLAFMALCRIKTIEKLGKESPGEFGKILGLDRIPGVKCLREKIGELVENNQGEQWGEKLAKKWMEDAPDLTGALYIDGHVRLYGGKEKMPKIYVSRERLCLRGMMDFWVNDMLGQPFFVIRKAINPGMITTLKEDIVPRLLNDIPNQPSKEELDANPCLHRFILVFDREGYSPKFFKEMWDKHRIACMTYHKFPKEDWSEESFEETSVTLISGETVSMKLAEKLSCIGSKKDAVLVKEVRKLTESGHQTSIVSTAYALKLTSIAVLMFARWCQENFFNYMMQHFAIDLLSDYNKKDISDTEKMISPKWRLLDRKKKSLTSKLATRKVRFANFTLNPKVANNTKKYKEWEKAKIDLVENIENLTKELEFTKNELENMEKYIKMSDLPKNEQFKRLDPSKKNLVDSIKMVSYRAETAMANIIANECGSFSKARSLLQTLFISDADILPDNENKILNVRIHNLSTRALNLQLDKLLIFLNKSKMKYPATDMILRYSRVGEN